jgi:putative ABC transport system ATP-binding protein
VSGGARDAAASAAPAISLRDIRKRYPGGAEVLQGASLEVAPGDFVAVVGASGSGKSTLLHIVGGLDADFSGEARVAGHDLGALGDRALARFRNETVGFVFQSFNLIKHLTTLDNVTLPAAFAADGGAPRARVRERAHEALARVGLAGKEKRRPDELSGGERQRVAIARALFARPSLLLADEPTGNLDARTGQEVIELFAELNVLDRVTVLVVTHEERVSKAAGRVLHLGEGKLAPASPGEVAA